MLTIDLLDHYDLDLVEKMNERDGMTITFKALPDNKYYQYIKIDYTKLSQDDLSEEEREILGISEFGS